MKIFYSPYELVFKNSKAIREGSLLKIIFDNQLPGYSDLHPWTEFGNSSLQDELSTIRSGGFSALSRQSYSFAKLDALARSKSISLLDPGILLKSYFLVMNSSDLGETLLSKIRSQGFTTLKIKVKSNAVQELQNFCKNAKHLQSFNIRLDFNQNTSYRGVIEFLAELHKLELRVDYIEDPFLIKEVPAQRFEPSKIVRDWLARDWDDRLTPNIASIQIFKPARSQAALPGYERTVFTSYLDHPVGQACAAFAARQFGNLNETHGLRSDFVYETNLFSECFDNTPVFTGSKGFGLGFDSQLEARKWIPLI